VLVFELGALLSGDFHDQTVRIQGRNIVQLDPSPLEVCLGWSREHTPREAVIIAPIAGDHRSPTNAGYEAPAVAQRAVIAVDDLYHGRRYTSFVDRVQAVEGFLSGETVAESTEYFQTLTGAPLYAIVEITVPAQLDRYQKAGWSPVFEQGSHMVLRLTSDTFQVRLGQ
jgi:hypothetical protein